MAMALSIRDPNGAVSRRYTALDQQLADQICQLLKRLQIAGLVTAGLDTTAIGQMIFNNLNMMFMEFVKEERMPLSLLKDRVTQQNAPLLRLIRSSAAS